MVAAAPSRRTNGFILFERSVSFAASAATTSCSDWRCSTWMRYSYYGRRQAALSGALALVFDRAAALFGTKAAAAERHRATMRRCIFKIARRAAILPSVVTSFGFGVREHAPKTNEIRVVEADRRRRWEAPALSCTASYRKRPLWPLRQDKRAPRPGRTVKND